MRVVLTGAAGRIGRRLARRLVAEGHSVVAVDVAYRRELAESEGVEFQVVDLREATGIYEILDGAGALLHFGNHPHVHSARPRVVYGENVVMNQHVFEAATQVGVEKVLFASSIQAMGGGRRLTDEPMKASLVPELPMTGAMPANPTDLYGLSKVAGEDLLRMLARDLPWLSAVALRLPHVSDARLPRKVDVEALAASGWGKRTNLDEGFSYLCMDDLDALVVRLLERMEPGYDCLLPASEVTQTRWPASRLAERLFPGTALRAGWADRQTLVDNGPITERYGWEPLDLSPDLAAEEASKASAEA